MEPINSDVLVAPKTVEFNRLANTGTIQNEENSTNGMHSRAPRYTSYPTADHFVESFGPANTAHFLSNRQTAHSGPLSLYVHIPFCSSLCYYCACNKTITSKTNRGQAYVETVLKELDLVDSVLEGNRQVIQMHWGGGTPTYLQTPEIKRLIDGFKAKFVFSEKGEYSIEIDPRTVKPHTLEDLAQLGFNRLSLGVQDFDHDVQLAINRVQPESLVRSVLEKSRSLGFSSTNFDLIYGLPKQTTKGYEATLNSLIDMRPERIALYNYAHMPARFKSQRLIKDADMPSLLEKQRIFELANERLDAAGYENIGMDHFALPDDELSVAKRQGLLHRNFQGYSTQPDCDVIGFGASSISRIGESYSQNARSVKEYSDCIEKNNLATIRGIELSRDNVIRRAAIMALMCQGMLDKRLIEAENSIIFDRYFSKEILILKDYEKNGFVDLTQDLIQVTTTGRRQMLRSIGSIFDRYLQSNQQRDAYSRIS